MSLSRTIKHDFGGGMPLFISSVRSDVSEQQMRDVFENHERLGSVRNIRFASHRDGRFKMAFITFRFWNISEKTRDFQTRIQTERKVVVAYSNVGYWNVHADKRWLDATYDECATELNENFCLLQDNFDIQKKLLDKYRESSYDWDYEREFTRDMRELYGRDDVSFSS